MTEIVLKPELLKGLQKVLVEYEPKNDRDDILKQLMEFTQYVYDQQTNSTKENSSGAPSQSSEDAYGKWKPE